MCSSIVKLVKADPSIVVSQGQSIQEAINSASDGDKIFVQSGIYYENVIVNKSITLVGENPSITFINGNGYGNVLTIKFSNVMVENFTIENGGFTEGNKGSSVQIYKALNVSIFNCIIRKSYYGINLFESNCCKVMYNIIANNSAYGMYFAGSSNNSIVDNTISNHPTSVSIATNTSQLNKFCHNNFINNINIPTIYAQTLWDDGYPSGGNYWSDYTGVDEKSGPYQNETTPDGIGDTYHPDVNDKYPFMSPLTAFRAGTWDNMTYYVHIVSNSTVSNFQLNATEKLISFNVTGSESTAGFCRVTIPNIIVQDLWHGNYIVLLNGELWPFRNWTDTVNIYIYVSYVHSEHQLIVLPEFLSIEVLQLFLTVTLFIVILMRKFVRKLCRTLQ